MRTISQGSSLHFTHEQAELICGSLLYTAFYPASALIFSYCSRPLWLMFMGNKNHLQLMMSAVQMQTYAAASPPARCAGLRSLDTFETNCMLFRPVRVILVSRLLRVMTHVILLSSCSAACLRWWRTAAESAILYKPLPSSSSSAAAFHTGPSFLNEHVS